MYLASIGHVRLTLAAAIPSVVWAEAGVRTPTVPVTLVALTLAYVSKILAN